jgi:hypothetical protein
MSTATVPRSLTTFFFRASAQGLSGTYAWISTGGSSGVDTILGQKFLESFYSVYDSTNGRVGFAPRT